MVYLEDKKSLITKGITQLLEIKDIDIRLLSLYQCRHAVDHAIHVGGAFSATIPMVSLFYGGIIDVNIEQPTATDQDMFVLSKGHAVATLASIYADLGYFDKSILENSRSISSVLNGHPGPLLPGVHVATGPMGQGMGVAQGFAIAGQKNPGFDVYAMTGDGELQEGSIWEAVMFAGYKRLENLCIMVDNNEGQLDNVSSLHFPYHGLGISFASFGWRVMEVDATQYHSVYGALSEFKYGKRAGRPTVIICKATKGQGGFSTFMNNHKTSITPEMLDQETERQEQLRARREEAFCRFFNTLAADEMHKETVNLLRHHASGMEFDMKFENDQAMHVMSKSAPVKIQKAAVRNKKINYVPDALPKLEKGKTYAAHKVIEAAMHVFARDERIVSVDSDLASTSGLQAGVGFVDKSRALNAGVAEANMMLIGEAFGILGANVWISTFCPFYDWKVLRRIAVGHQERLEVIADHGWLSEGHDIDLTMVATAADLETQSNGATHMGNDDALLLNEAAHIKIINVSCPQQLLAVMKWIAEGNKGLVYLRILRAPASVIYESDFTFEFGKAYQVKHTKASQASIVSSGRGVYEALEAADILEKKGISVNVIDMPSVDDRMILDLYQSGKAVFIAEQNNGYLWTNFRKALFAQLPSIDVQKLIPINTVGQGGLHYIHSGTYAELAAHYGLDAKHLSEKILKTLNT
ncbi:transketolase C-terminal domain-containing protein [Catalinimonas niigatensis]|uniref:transketolase C-terminal domain-containing protein n=1 Tax=Catalinimonas niigatensis TaxID=1397264 RepID=UPI0026653344|nr:transketolase C-terminal domain-containing protein [Catalinimonas niigatensis]WPP49179.1 transketolase C-terminal domain-containing protein [Catalinimonas niigatensis]